MEYEKKGWSGGLVRFCKRSKLRLRWTSKLPPNGNPAGLNQLYDTELLQEFDDRLDFP